MAYKIVELFNDRNIEALTANRLQLNLHDSSRDAAKNFGQQGRLDMQPTLLNGRLDTNLQLFNAFRTN